MVNSKFKEIYRLSKELQSQFDKQNYDRLSKTDKSMETFDEYLLNEEKELNKKLSDERKKKVEDLYIFKDTIIKDDIKFSLYLFHVMHTEPIEFDENYKPLPLKEKEIFEYGTIISTEDETGYYNISGVFGGIEYNEELAIEKYKFLKKNIENTSLDELLEEVKKSIIEQINNKN